MKLPLSFRSTLGALFFVFALPAVSSGGTVIFSDDTFVGSNWSVTDDLLNNGGVSSGTNFPTGGVYNDGHRRIAILVSGADEGEAGVWSFHSKQDATYNPSTSGAILTIKYSEWSIKYDIQQSCGMALRQGGVIYYGPRWTFDSFHWQVTTQAALTANDFDTRDFTNQHPDFSGTGGPIEFGFVRANSSPSFPYSTLGGIDNWYVELTTEEPVATEPATWGKIKALYRN